MSNDLRKFKSYLGIIFEYLSFEAAESKIYWNYFLSFQDGELFRSYSYFIYLDLNPLF